MRELKCEILECNQRGDGSMEAAGDGPARKSVQI